MRIVSEARGLLELLPWVLKRISPTVNEELQLLTACIPMVFRHVDFLPVMRDMSVVGRFAGLEVVIALLEVRSAGLKVLVANSVRSCCGRSLSQVGPRDSLTSLLDSISKTKFGHGCIVEDGKFVATVALRDLIEYASNANRGGGAGVRVTEIASPTVSLPREATVTELLNTFLTKRIRRVVVRGVGKPAIADDRLLAQSAFSPEGLLTIRNTPEKFFQRALSSLALLDLGSIGGNEDVAEAWSMIYRNPAECLLVEDEDKMLTPWDAVIKLCAQGKFPSS